MSGNVAVNRLDERKTQMSVDSVPTTRNNIIAIARFLLIPVIASLGSVFARTTTLAMKGPSGLLQVSLPWKYRMYISKRSLFRTASKSLPSNYSTAVSGKGEAKSGTKLGNNLHYLEVSAP